MFNINNGEINLLCSLDLSKGFDVLNHNILLYKLFQYNISSSELQWFESYLSNHTQFVRIVKNTSNSKSIDIVVPQGTVLGPILFLI